MHSLDALMHNLNRFYILSTLQYNRQSKKGYIHESIGSCVTLSEGIKTDEIKQTRKSWLIAENVCFQNFHFFCQRNRRIPDSPGISSNKHGDQISYEGCWSLGWGLSTYIPLQRDPWKACRLRILSVIYEFRVCGIKDQLLSSTSYGLAQSVCQWAFSLLAIWCLRPWWVRILLWAEEDNLSPFDSNIACLCQSIEINNNKHVWLRLLPKPDDPLAHKTIKCSSYCSCFNLMSDTFSISYHGPSLRDSKTVMLLLSLVLWANSTNPVIQIQIQNS